MMTVRTLLLILLVSIFVDPVWGQENETIYFGEDTVSISAEQNARFNDLEERLGGEVDSIVDEIKEKQSVLRKKQDQYESAKLALLTPKQHEFLAKMRRQRLLDESHNRNANDAEFLSQFLPILRAMHEQKSIQIFEGPQRIGLVKPEPPVEKDTVVYVKKHFFFQEPLKLSEDEDIVVSTTIGNYRSFNAYSGSKMCGGFHPDANIQVKTAKQMIHVLICFGCHEAKFVVGDEEMLVDLDNDAYFTLRKILLKNFRIPRRSEGLFSK